MQTEEITRHAEIGALVAYWAAKRPAPDRLPAKTAIDPAELRATVANLALFEVIDGGEDFALRLAGTAVEESYGRSMKGFRIGSLGPERATAVGIDDFRTVMRTRSPHYKRFVLDVFDRHHVKLVRVLLPLARDGWAVDTILGGYWPASGRS